MFRNVDTGKQEGITYHLEADANRMRNLLEANGQSYRIAEAAIDAAESRSRTVADVVQEHIDLLIKPGPQTIHNYRAMLEHHIKDSLGAAAVNSIDYRHITGVDPWAPAQGARPQDNPEYPWTPVSLHGNGSAVEVSAGQSLSGC